MKAKVYSAPGTIQKASIASWILALCMLPFPTLNALQTGFLGLSFLLSLSDFFKSENRKQLVQHPGIWLILYWLILVLSKSWTSEQFDPGFENYSREITKKAALLLAMAGFGVIGRSVFQQTARIGFVAGMLGIIGLDFYRTWAILPPNEKYDINGYTYDFLIHQVFWQPIYAALFAGMGLLFLINDTWFHPTAWIRKSGYVAFGILSVFLVLSSARTGLAAAVLAGGYLLIPKIKWSRKTIGIGIVGLVVVSGIVWSTPTLRNRITTAVNGADLKGSTYAGGGIRLKKWENALELISQKPLLGYGSGSENALLEQYRKTGFTIGYENKFNAHNQFLESGLELGIVGMSLLLLFFIAGFRQAYIHHNRLQFAAFLMLFISFLTESMLERHWGLMMIVVIYSITASREKSVN